MKPFSIVLYCLLIPYFLLGQIQGTFHIKKPSTKPLHEFSIKNFYPDSLEITPLKVLGFDIAIQTKGRDPIIQRVEGEVIPQAIRNTWYATDSGDSWISYYNIRVENKLGEESTLRKFHSLGGLERSKFPVYKRLKDLYPNPHINKNVEKFVSYKLTVVGDDYYFSRIVTEDRFMIDFFCKSGFTLRFQNILILTKDGREINVDPFVLDSQFLL